MSKFKFMQVFLVSAIILFSIVISCSEQSKAGEMKIAPYVFENSGGEKVEAERGRLWVTENRSKFNSRLIELAFIRFKSTSSKPGTPIVYLAGGPGGSGIASARGSRFSLFMVMREFGDVIVLDQRDVGDSKPNLGCSEIYDLPLDKPLARIEFVRIVGERSCSCAARLRAQGVDLSGYNTNENADDVEDLRQALNAPKISLWAISYDTTLGLNIIKRHGARVDRAILAGVEGFDDALKSPLAVEQHLAEINRYVKADAILHKQIPDFLALVRDTLGQLEKEPATVEATDPQTKQKIKVVINKYVMQLLTASAIGTDAIKAFPRLYTSAAKGDFSEIAPQLVNHSNSEIGSAMAFMTDCSNGASPERRCQISRESKITLLGNAADIVFPDICSAWNSRELGAGFRRPVKSKIPVLFISGTLDGRTPPDNAEAVRRGFPNATHLIIEKAWHRDPLFLSSPKIKDAMMEFMQRGTTSITEIKLASPKFAPLK